MQFPIEEILQELGFLFTHEELALSQRASAYQKEVALQAQSTKQRIRVAQKHVDLSSEASRRQMLIAPIILDLVHLVDVRVNIEYKIEVNQFLRGDVDYYLKSKHHVPIVEAKQADLGRGFVQLATELIALDAWIDSKDQIIYGAVTTGDIVASSKIETLRLPHPQPLSHKERGVRDSARCRRRVGGSVAQQ